MTAENVEQAYRHCLHIARSHYENFPVASRLLPARLRRPVAAIYAFARAADDLADEGTAAPADRLAALEAFGRRLDAAAAGRPDEDPVFVALADIIAHCALPVAPLHDLLHAFSSDVTTHRYESFEAVLGYCRYSANPIGRLLLHLDGAATEENLTLSDDVCSALQLINFLQDIAQDYDENGRIYLPQDEMREYGVHESDIAQRRSTPAMRALVNAQIRRASALLCRGAPLAGRLHGRLGWELRLIVLGGQRILQRLYASGADVFARPRLGAGDWAWMLWRALRRGTPPALPSASRRGD
ncbi:MAG TPA: squalene synthase HpnC [Gammaproteobacteria bacterium]|nr:squalene synthase HpnC [Gammaproteobacteria bacterium]